MDDVKFELITCVPVRFAAELGYPNTHYEQIPCPLCTQLMYLGPLSKARHQKNRTPLMCMECAIRQGILTSEQDVISLGGP
jgi:hypothetical protein